MQKGYVQVYTGNGKGKTTCMLGLALRACGAGKKIYLGQFMKDEEYSEIKAIKNFLPQVTVEQYGTHEGFVAKGKASENDLECARNGYEKAYCAATSGVYDVVLIDEINVAAYMELLKDDDLLRLIEDKAAHTELVLTGRYASKAVIERADLVTEMGEIKHYYKQGVPARTGIEM